MPVIVAFAVSLLLGPLLLVDAAGSASCATASRDLICKETRGALLLQRASANATDQGLQLSEAMLDHVLKEEDRLWIFRLLCFPMLTLFCFWYELWQPSSSNEEKPTTGSNLQAAAARSSLPAPRKQRLPVWDVARFILELWVICHHMPGAGGLVMTDSPSPMDGWNRLFLPMRMTGFSMITGMFGSSMTRESLSKMCCYTFGTCLLASMLYTWEPGHGLNLEAWLAGIPMPFHLWYLRLLPFWRLTITPFFHLVCEKFRMPALVPFIITYVLLYVIRHSGLERAQFDASMDAKIKNFIGDFCFYGTFFALGLCMSASHWAHGLLHSWTLMPAVMLLGVYWIRYCNTVLDPFDGGHFPRYMQEDPMSIQGFVKDSLLMSQSTCLTLSAFAVIAHFSVILARCAPKVCDFVAGCGSRTLYAYVLHPLCILSIQSAVTWETCEKPLHAAMTIAFAMLMNVVLCTRASELLFKWMLLPYWMLDAGPWFIGNFRAKDTIPTK